MSAAEEWFGHAVMAQHAALDWAVGYCAKRREGCPLGRAIEGLILDKRQLAAIGVDFRNVLISLSQNRHGETISPTLEFYARSIERAAFRLPDGGVDFIRPGCIVPEGAEIEMIIFRPFPECVPYCDIMMAVKQAAARIGLQREDMAFFYAGREIHSVSALSDLINNRGTPLNLLCEAIDAWRDRVLASEKTNAIDSSDGHSVQPVTEVPESPPESNRDDLPAMPVVSLDSIESSARLVYRCQLAKLLGRSPRTLGRWDKNGMAVNDLPWVPGKRVSGNLVVYDLALNFDTIQALLPRGRDRRRDQRLAHELGRGPSSDCDWHEGELPLNEALYSDVRGKYGPQTEGGCCSHPGQAPAWPAAGGGSHGFTEKGPGFHQGIREEKPVSPQS